jgi:hypothetical protein
MMGFPFFNGLFVCVRNIFSRLCCAFAVLSLRHMGLVLCDGI